MRNKFQILDDYRIAQNKPWQSFSRQVGIPWQTLYKTVKGLTEPNARTKKRLEDWLKDNLSEIIATLH